MNALMTIRVRVLNQGGPALASLRTQVQSVQKTVQQSSGAIASAFGGRGGFVGAVGGLEKMGKSLQWTGRQLAFNFTLPLVAAGVAAGKWANEFEEAMTKVRKVYGDGSQSASELNGWVNELGRTFTILSDIFGVNRAEVAQIGAAWAAAGREGVGLARSVRQTLEIMILGEMDWETSIKSLLTIQEAFHLSVREMHEALTVLNQVENQTAVTFPDLIDVVTRAGGAAVTAGVSIRELAAMTASLVPITGSASQAGNALKTIFSRLLAPTKQATDLLGELGINVASSSWQSQNATERIKTLARAYEDLTGPQKAVADSLLASRFQINKFGTLVDDILDPTGRFQNAMEATADSARNEATYLRELNVVLSSSPQAWKIMWTQLQNALAKAIIPLIPALQSLLSYVVRLANAFASLSPQTQQWIMLGLIALAAIGPIAQFVGSVELLAATMGKALIFASRGLGALFGGVLRLFGLVRVAFSGIFTFIGDAIVGAVTTVVTAIGGLAGAVEGAAVLPAALIVAGVVAAIAVVVALMTGHRDWLMRVWKSIGDFIHRVWMSLPQSVRNAFTSVITIIAAAISKIRDLLSYLNPFAKHSPSLVDQVDRGTTEISKQYETTQPGIEKARGSVQRLSSAHRGLQAAPSAVAPTPTADASVTAYQQVVQALQQVERQVAANAAAVSKWNGVMASSQKALDSWTAATAHAADMLEEIQRAEDLKDILAFAPGAAAAAARLATEEKKVKAAMTEVTAAITAQEAVVARWQRDLEAAELALKNANDELDRLQEKASSSGDALSEAQDHLAKLSSTPIQGMRAMSDAIFANEMAVKRMQLALINADKVGTGLNESIYQNSIAQKKLQLEIMRTEDAVGMSADDAASKLSALQGEIESLQSQASELRLAGAGSDVLAPFNQQIAALKAQQGSIRTNTASLTAMQDQLDALGRSGQMMDLERELNLAPLNRQLELLQQKAESLDLQNSLKFDPLTRQIEQLTNGIQEMPFGQLISEITNTQSAIESLTAAHEADLAAVAAQQAIVDQLTAHRERVAAGLDLEKTKLDALNDSYQAMNDQLQAMQQNYDNISSAAQKAKAAKESAASAALDAAGAGDFPDVTGSGAGLTAEAGTLSELQALNDAWEKQIKSVFGNLDIFDPIKKQWKKFTEWWDKNVDIHIPKIDMGGIGNFFSTIGAKLAPVGDLFRKVFEAIDPSPIIRIFRMVGDTIIKWVQTLVEQFRQWDEVWAQLVPAVEKVMTVVLFLLNNALLTIGVLWRTFWPIIINVLKPILDGLIGMIRAALEIVRGAIVFFLAILNGDWSAAWGALKTMVDGVWDGIYNAIKMTLGLIIGVIRSIIESIISVFQFLYDKLIGHSIIPDLINGIIALWNTLTAPIQAVMTAIWTLIQIAWNLVKATFDAWAAYLKTVWLVAFQVVQVALGLVWAAISTTISTTWNIIRGVLNIIIAFISGVFTTTWNVLGTVIGAVWRGISGAVGAAWGAIKPVLDTIIGFIKGTFQTAFESVGGVIGRVWDGIKNATQTVWDTIKSIIRNSVNVVIDVINAFIRGIKTIANAIPGVHINISEIGHLQEATGGGGGGGGLHQLASGGIMTQEFGWVPGRGVGSGFVTKKPTAIVGEGSKTHPEYVIPTDPAHRDRALQLAAALLSRLGGTVPGYGIGFGDLNPINVGKGIIDKAGGVIGDVAGWVREHGAKALMAPYAAIADRLLSTLPDSWIKDMAIGVKNKIYDWIAGVDSDIQGGVNAAHGAGIGVAPTGGGGGGQVSGAWQAITGMLSAAGVPFIVTSTTGGHHVAGSKHYQGKAVDLAQSAAGMLRIFNFLAHGKGLDEVFYDPPGWYVDRGVAKTGRIGGHSDHVHAATFARGGFWPMAEGGVVYAPTRALVGENGPEAVAPLDVLLNPIREGFNDMILAVRSLDEHEALRASRLETLLSGDADRLIDKISGLGDSVADVTAAVGQLGTDLGGKLDAIASSISTLSAGQGGGGGSAPSSGGGSSGSILNQPGALPGIIGSVLGIGGLGRRSTSTTAGSNFIGTATAAQLGAGLIAPPSSWKLSPATTYNWLANAPIVSAYGGGSGIDPRYPVSIMASGGIVRATSGGSIIRAGEARRDEAIIPLPGGWSADSLGKKEYHFHGNLEFPNVTTEHDADGFLRNLENLVD